MLLSNSQIGNRGERIATKWLRERGYMIVDLNWRSGRYEIDIVAQKWDLIHLVEVKSRVATGYTTPEEAINPSKQEAMFKAARMYCAQKNVQQQIQFDLIAVEEQHDGSFDIRHIENIIEFKW